VVAQHDEAVALRGVGKLGHGKAAALSDLRIVPVDVGLGLGLTNPGTTRNSNGSFVTGAAFSASLSR
jgi:hypothetical protein